MKGLKAGTTVLYYDNYRSGKGPTPVVVLASSRTRDIEVRFIDPTRAPKDYRGNSKQDSWVPKGFLYPLRSDWASYLTALGKFQDLSNKVSAERQAAMNEVTAKYQPEIDALFEDVKRLSPADLTTI